MAAKITAFLLLTTALASQTPLKTNKHNPMTIGARSELSVSHLAEIAEVDISIQACHDDEDQATKYADAHLEKLQDLLRPLGLTNTSVPFPTTVHKGEEWDDFEFRRSRHSKFDDEDKNEDEPFCGSASLLVTVHDLDLLSHLDRNLSAQHATAKLSYTQWKLSESTQTKQRLAIRRKALEEMDRIAADYAQVFDAEEIVATSFDEQYAYDNVLLGGRRGKAGWRGEVDMRVPDVQTFMEFKFEFRVM